jgi:hypothetical protein
VTVTKFLPHDTGWVNAADVESIVDGSSGGSYLRVRDRDLSYRSRFDAAVLVAYTWHVISANPGFFVLRWWPPGSREDLTAPYRAPVIAWRIGDGDPVPVTADGWEWRPDLSIDDAAVLNPTGAVRADDGAPFDTEAEWVTQCISGHENRTAERAKAKEDANV